MYVAVVPNRGSRPAILLRESYRDGDKVKNRTLKNLSDWPAERIQLLRAVLRGETLVPAGEGLAIVRALPHGHVSAALGTARRIGLDRLLPRRPERRRKLALALIVARLIDPAAKLATARALDATTAIHSLGATLGLGAVTAKEVYAALDWLGRAQPAIEKALARRHLEDGCLVLYDLTSSYLEGRCCALARFGYSPATVGATSRRSSSGCCAPPTAARSRSRCSKAIPPIRPRSPVRLPRSRTASG